MGKMSTAARTELVNALARRYAVGTRAEKNRILDEFEAVTGFHRKHAMRVLRSGSTASGTDGRGGRRIYDDAVREALVVLWEASDRICGKRLKALMPTLVAAMERHGHLQLGPDIRAGLLAMSPATIDRSLRGVRERAGRKRRRRAPSPVRASIPVRTFSDWYDPPPGFAEADLVAHSGPVPKGSFVQTLVVTDVATGWTECAPVLYREQTLLREVLGEVRRLMPFDLLGFDTDNDSVFINETLRDYCRDAGIVFTRCRPWRRNDQAFVEQKNGSVVRRIVGYRRLEGLDAAAALSRLYATTRLYVNFFQPSFKLASKRRDGARVSKRYHAPATPRQRLLAATDRRDRRPAGRGPGRCGGPASRALPRQPADGLGRRGSEAHCQTIGEAQAGAAAPRPAGQGHGAAACLVRGRALEHQPAAARTPAGGASGRIPGQSTAHSAAASEGMAPGEGHGHGVRRVAAARFGGRCRLGLHEAAPATARALPCQGATRLLRFATALRETCGLGPAGMLPLTSGPGAFS